MGRLDGKVALITGISSGIGRATTKLFIQEGASVLGVDRDQSGAETLQIELGELKQQLHTVIADLAQLDQVIPLVKDCLDRWQRIDILFNCAGISKPEVFPETTPETLRQLFAINFEALFFLCQQAIPVMLDQKGGVIINTASELAIVGQPLYTAYCGSKGAVLSFTRALAVEYARHNIRINAICPGPIDTPMLHAEFALGSDPQLIKQENIDSMPIGRLGTAEEIAQVALFLAADAPALMQGAALVVDGAKTII